MDADRWRQISRLYHEALERPVDERSAFLDVACSGDEALRGQVYSLLANEASAQAFLAAPAAEVVVDRFPENSPTLHGRLEPGGKLGAYQIDRPLGRGGMGLVFLALDTTLHRHVALKILDSPSDGEGARARLLREARNAAALNHPNICTVYEVGEADGRAFIAMEYVDGRPLSDRLAEAALPLEEALRYGIEAADALAYAHDHGVIHRDLKAANAMITTAGRLKLVDFGLARREDALLADATTMPSLAPGGVAVGTPYSMAPEQVRGGGTDARTDIWALGVLLYEMVTGAKPFTAPTMSELFSSILRDAPARLPDATPVALKSVIERCLEKDPGRRYQHARELGTALEAIQAGTVSRWTASRSHLVRRRWLALAAVTLAALVGATTALDVGRLRTRLLGISTPAPVRSLVVLPLVNLSGDSEQEYFADGMTEALTSDLAKLGALRVVSRTSAMNYKDTRKSVPVIANELSVDAVVEGSVLRVGQRVRIVAQLIQASTDAALWTDTYERDLQDVLRLQSEVAQAIAQEIRVAITPEERTRLAKRVVNPEAYEAYLKGMFWLNKYTPEGLEKGLGYLQQAVDLDPADPFAWSGLAVGYTLVGHDRAEYLIRAKAAAQKAVELGEPLAQTYVALGLTKLQSDWDFAGAQRDLRRATELNPSLGEAHRGYSWSLQVVGRRDEAFAAMKRAREVEPLTPLFASDLAWQYLVAGQSDAAMDEARKALELNPNFSQGFGQLGRVYRSKGMFEDAIAAHQRAPRWALAATYAFAGRHDEARKIAAEIGKEKPGAEKDWALANVYAALGEKDEAFRRLEAAYKSRYPLMPWIRDWPELAPLRDDPRLEDLARRIGVP